MAATIPPLQPLAWNEALDEERRVAIQAMVDHISAQSEALAEAVSANTPFTVGSNQLDEVGPWPPPLNNGDTLTWLCSGEMAYGPMPQPPEPYDDVAVPDATQATPELPPGRRAIALSGPLEAGR